MNPVRVMPTPVTSKDRTCQGNKLNEAREVQVMANAPPGSNTGPAHVSYSQYAEWLKCGKSYELKRIIGLSETPAWWSIGGKGVHSATEKYDLHLLSLEATK